MHQVVSRHRIVAGHSFRADLLDSQRHLSIGLSFEWKSVGSYGSVIWLRSVTRRHCPMRLWRFFIFAQEIHLDHDSNPDCSVPDYDLLGGVRRGGALHFSLRAQF